TDNMESDLIEEAIQLNTRKEYVAWEQRCDELIEFMEEQSRTKRPRLAVGHRQFVVARIARLESLKDSMRGRFVHVGAGYGLRWREIETTFKSRIVTGAIINSNHIEPRRFLEDTGTVVLERVRDVVERHGSVKVNTAFNGDFATKDKRANKSIITKNSEIYRCTDILEWYERHVVEPILASLEEFQERDSGWALSRILNLTVNVNKLNPMRAGCHFEVPREITLKKAVVSVKSMDNACFAWSVVAALYPAKSHVDRKLSYLHYTTVLNLTNIEFPMTLKDISKFEHLNAVSINVYGIENKQIRPLRLTGDKKQKHINLLYLQDPRNDGVGHFAWIKNLSRLVSMQLTRKKNKKNFCGRCLHYFGSSQRLQTHEVDCQKLNYCATRLPSENDRWLEFSNHCNQERVPFVVYADLECVLRKTEPDKEDASPYEYQRHEVFSMGYYVRCSYDNSLSSYDFRRDENCIA
ncbi:hypothetical protein ALC57_01246, partial [Trachymyrmex cornetzi]